jgi:hypothetical protein
MISFLKNLPSLKLLSFYTTHILLGIVHWTHSSCRLQAQSSLEGEVWAGYIQSVHLGANWSLWNDFHYVPSSFLVGRHGLTYQIPKSMAISGGYAWLLTASPAQPALTRRESRLWIQAEQFHDLNDLWTLRWRFRYDARYRQNLESGLPINSRSLTHRPRFLLGLRYRIYQFNSSTTLSFNLLNEFIVQHNPTAPLYWVDQHRIFMMPTLRYKQHTIMLGPLLRLIPNSSGEFNYRLGPCLLVIQNFRKTKPSTIPLSEDFLQVP